MGAGTLTGCSGLGGNSFELVPRGTSISNVENATGLNEGEVGRSARVELGQGQYTAFSFETPERAQLELTGQVVSGGEIDVYIMSNDDYSEFQREPNIVSSQSASEGVESLGLNQTVASGQYQFVFDNTYVGGTEPSGDVEIQFEFTLTEPRSQTPGQS